MRLMIQAQLKLSHPEKAVQELYELIFVLQNGRLEDLQLLHELDSNDQWKDDLEKIEKSVDEDVLIELYDFLKEDEKLLDLMEKSKTITTSRVLQTVCRVLTRIEPPLFG